MALRFVDGCTNGGGMSEKKDKWEIGYSKESIPFGSPGRPFCDATSTDISGKLLDGRFFIEKDLTESGADAGGIGIVFLARDMKLLGREVVVKILQKDASKNEDVARKFLHEKEALIRLDHPNIVRILDSGEFSDGNPFMVMEYIPGYSLRRTMSEKGQLPFAVVANVVESVSSALGVAHEKGIIHRDLKPENIMLTPQSDEPDRVRLIDFGIARVERSQLAPVTTISRGIGTVRYIAPEQLAGSIDHLPAADIYSLGIVVYEMLTGELPFKPESEVEMYMLQQQGVQMPPRSLRIDLSPDAEKLLLSALEFEAEKRPHSIREFGSRLATVLRNTADEGSAMSPSPEPTILASAPILYDSQEPDNGSILTPFKGVGGYQLESEDPQPKTSSKPLLWALIALIAVSALAVPTGIALWPSLRSVQGDNANSVPSLTEPSISNANIEGLVVNPKRELSYYLMIQKIRDGKPFEDPYRSSGQETLESGYKFKMFFEPDANGYMYVFNEGKDSQGNVGFNILFPTPNVNTGSSQVVKGQKIETAQNTLGGGRGTEVMWVIWSNDENDDLEAARRSAFDQRGRVGTDNVAALQNFLDKQVLPRSESSKDAVNQRTIVTGHGNTVVHRFEIEHR